MDKQLAFIVPYRNREWHLKQFIPHYKRRFPSAHIYIIEQGDDLPFKRGKLLNVGFKQFQDTFDYCAFHDIDMLVTKGYDYSYPSCPTQLATKVQQFGYRMPFPEYFGGVTLFRKEDFILCNGYSNEMAGWGAEDNLLRDAVLRAGLRIEHRQCFYQSLSHKREVNSELHQKNVEIWNSGPKPDDGLSHCQYHVIKQEDCKDYIKLTVEL